MSKRGNTEGTIHRRASAQEHLPPAGVPGAAAGEQRDAGAEHEQAERG